MTAPLAFDDVRVRFGAAEAVAGVSLALEAGEIFGIVGESGSGKSTLANAVMGLLPGAATVSGSIRVDGREMVGLDEASLRTLRGRSVSMIFQDPTASLDPTWGVGDQIAETIRAHGLGSAREARTRAIALMDEVGIARAAERYRDVPHRFSGGQRQRIVIAAALANDPKLLIADEPTTALDVTIQAQILDLLRDMNRELGTAILFISHDLGVIREVCDRVIVMYAGYIVEDAPVGDILERPKHPYTAGLLQALPSVGKRGRPLYTIPGRVPPLADRGTGCPFAGRCSSATDLCEAVAPELTETSPDHRVRCHLYADGGRAV